MYGSTMGVLNVYALVNGDRELIWSQSGNQGNQWNLVEIEENTIPTHSDETDRKPLYRVLRAHARQGHSDKQAHNNHVACSDRAWFLSRE